MFWTKNWLLLETTILYIDSSMELYNLKIICIVINSGLLLIIPQTVY